MKRWVKAISGERFDLNKAVRYYAVHDTKSWRIDIDFAAVDHEGTPLFVTMQSSLTREQSLRGLDWLDFVVNADWKGVYVAPDFTQPVSVIGDEE